MPSNDPSDPLGPSTPPWASQQNGDPTKPSASLPDLTSLAQFEPPTALVPTAQTTAQKAFVQTSDKIGSEYDEDDDEDDDEVDDDEVDEERAARVDALDHEVLQHIEKKQFVEAGALYKKLTLLMDPDEIEGTLSFQRGCEDLSKGKMLHALFTLSIDSTYLDSCDVLSEQLGKYFEDAGDLLLAAFAYKISFANEVTEKGDRLITTLGLEEDEAEEMFFARRVEFWHGQAATSSGWREGYELARHYAVGAEEQEAVSTLDPLCTRHPTVPELFFLRAQVLLELEELEQAQNDLLRAKELAPEDGRVEWLTELINEARAATKPTALAPVSSPTYSSTTRRAIAEPPKETETSSALSGGTLYSLVLFVLLAVAYIAHRLGYY